MKPAQKSRVFAAVIVTGLLLGMGNPILVSTLTHQSTGVLAVFYLVDRGAFDAVKEALGIDSNEADFALPSRSRPEVDKPQQESISYEASRDGWFEAENTRFHSAVLIAGSQGYSNYRHQADVCHAFQVLRRGGIPSDQIITFVFDDIAHHPSNPYPGQIFNKPGGINMYPGCAKDYTGWDVNKPNVFSVLRGDARAMAGKGSGRVLPKNPSQKVFLFYSDHGSVGSIGMPVGPPIYADELNHLLKSMASGNHFDEMLIYLESCDAGSMFKGFDLGPKIMAATAANAYESSYATYCPDESHYTTRYDVPNATYIGSCMGDLFSVSWMEDTDRINRSEVLVSEQLSRVKFRTSTYSLYIYGSHVMTYGDKHGHITREVIGNYLSYFVAPPSWRRSDLEVLNSNREEPSHHDDVRYDQRQADLLPLYYRAQQNDLDAAQELETALKQRNFVDKAIRSLVRDLSDRGRLRDHPASIEAYVTEEITPGVQVVRSWSCLRNMVSVWEQTCGAMDDYARQYTRAFANLCNADVQPSELIPSLANICPSVQ